MTDMHKQYTMEDVENLQESLKERLFLNKSRQIFEELLLTRWEYHCDPDFEINEDTGEYEDELVHMAWIGYYLAWNKWSK